jgi:RNA polymerase sigma factor (TIGR02999 family)
MAGLANMNEITRVLNAIDKGDAHAAEQLLPLVYDELRKLAAQKMAQEKPGQTLEATALVHEAYVRIVGKDHAQHWNGRAHFFAAAAEAMRRILIESARRKKTEKHGGAWQRCQLLETELAIESSNDNLLAVHEALDKLAGLEPEAAKVVQLRFFANFELKEIATCLDISLRTAHRHWTYARAWLARELSRAKNA